MSPSPCWPSTIMEILFSTFQFELIWRRFTIRRTAVLVSKMMYNEPVSRLDLKTIWFVTRFLSQFCVRYAYFVTYNYLLFQEMTRKYRQKHLSCAFINKHTFITTLYLIIFVFFSLFYSLISMHKQILKGQLSLLKNGSDFASVRSYSWLSKYWAFATVSRGRLFQDEIQNNDGVILNRQTWLHEIFC